MKTPVLKLKEVFKCLRSAVQDKSDNKQVPWDASSLTGDFFFVPPQELLEQQVATIALPQSSASVEAPKTMRPDEEVWLDIKNSKDPEDFRFFLEEFPESSLAKSARFKLKRLERKQAKNEKAEQKMQEEYSKRKSAEKITTPGTVFDVKTGLFWEKYKYAINQ